MLRTEHPLIAVNGLALSDDRLGLRYRYASAVLEAGGVPLAIPPVGGPSDLRRLVERVDGLLLPGGDDFDTERIGLGPTHPAAVRTQAAKQDFDFELARAALETELPVLGICYGMQLLALASGSGILQHLPEDRPGCQPHTDSAVHDVAVAPDTKLSRLLGVERLPVVSRHHQGIPEPVPGWLVSARDDEGLCEAIEKPNHPFAIGVQWHPELSPEGSPCARLFRGLVGAAAIRAARSALPATS